jgi:hypothetical protein
MRKHGISIDPYKAQTSKTPSQWSYHDLFDSEIQIGGFAFDNGMRLCRLPISQLPRFNEEIAERSYCTSGGVLRFDTDSTRLSVRVGLGHAFSRPFMTLMACRGLDFYVGTGKGMEYFATAMPVALELNYEYLLPEIKKSRRTWSVYLPVFAGIESLSIGIDSDADLHAPVGPQKKRIVFYWSSITQGVAVTRPGNTYVSQVGRMQDAEAINLGFAGNARGEPEMAEIIAGIKMDAFVMDYDHNSPFPSHLAKTHEHFYRIIRDRNPHLPILILTKPDFDTDRGNSEERRAVIYETYVHAVQAGDQNVYFIDGEQLYGRIGRDCCTADNCHPNDLGFYRMAIKISNLFKKIL